MSWTRGPRTAHALLLAGLLVQAATTYVFLIIAGRVLGAALFGSLSSLYLLVTSAATGLFQPLEQEVTRRRGTERVLGTRDTGLLWRAVAHGLAMSVGVAVLIVAFLPASRRAVGNETVLVIALLVSLPTYAVWFTLRGDLAGSGRLGRYGCQLAVDGTIRLIGAVLLASTGSTSVAWFGILLACSPWVALVATYRRRRPVSLPTVPGPPLARPLYLLVVSTVAAQVLNNAGPIVISLLATSAEREEAGVFLALLVVIRIPVVVFNAVQPSFLPHMAARATAGDRASFTRLVVLTLAGLGGVVLVSVALITAIGPRLVEFVFAFAFTLPRLVYLLLTLSIGLFLTASVIAQALIALGQHRWVSIGWVLGIGGLAVGTALGDGAVWRASNALLAGAAVAATSLALALGAALTGWRRRRTPDPLLRSRSSSTDR